MSYHKTSLNTCLFPLAMEDPTYDKPLLLAAAETSQSQSQSSSSASRIKLWHLIASGCALMTLSCLFMVAFLAWPRAAAPMQGADVGFRAVNLHSSAGGALLLDVDLGLELKKAEEQQLPNGNVKATLICSFVVNPSNNMIISRHCGSQRQISDETQQHPLLLTGSKASKVFTSWYMIVLYVLLGILILATVAWMLYPKTPEVTLEKLQLQGLSTEARMPSKDSYYMPKLNLDVKLLIALKIRNPNFIGVSYEKIMLFANYKGYQLCEADLGGDEIAARDDSTIEANVNVKCAQILFNTVSLATDAAMQELPVNLVVEFSGYIGRRWFRAPVKVGVSLDAKVDPVNTEIKEQDYHIV